MSDFVAQITFTNDTQVNINADWYEWYQTFLLFFANDSMDFFDKNNLKIVIINGETINIPN